MSLRRKPKIGIWANSLWDDFDRRMNQRVKKCLDKQEQLGWSDAQTAKKARLSPSTIYNLYYGHVMIPSSGTLFKLEKALGLLED